MVGAGQALRIFDIGKKKLLRKSENKSFPSKICSLNCKGDRIIVGDLTSSLFIVKYRKAEKQLDIVADNVLPRYLTASCVLDYNTVAGADKFGNVFVTRLPEEASEEIDTDPTMVVASSAVRAMENAHKMKEIANFFVGDIITSFSKASLIPGGQSVLFYTTVGGAIGALVPFTSREDVNFFTHLEMHLRQLNAPLCGRDHLAYRSYYVPVKDTIDGDYCEQFSALPLQTKQEIASELNFGVYEVTKKLEEMRTRFW